MARRRRLISLYTGAGGLDLGLEAAGFETAVAIEMDSDAVATLRHNRDWPVLDRDIHEISSDEILSVAEMRQGDAHLLVGGPPCQPFSKSGYWASGDARRLGDPRASTLEAYLRVLRDVRPKAFLLENVAGLAYRNKDEGLKLLRTTVDSINRVAGTSYSMSVALLKASDYGVPQDRERVFIIGQRDGVEFRFPGPTHSPGAERIFETEPVLTAWDAIGDLEDDDDPSLRMTGKWAELLPSIPEGQNYLYHTDRGDGLPLFGWRRRYWSFLLKLSKRIPAWTITAQPGSAIGPFHWKSRRLSMRELARLQTFPNDFEVLGSRSAYQRQLGNAVPSALAELLGRCMIRQLMRGRVPNRRLSLLPERRSPVPKPEPPKPVPKKYFDLIGEHEPHPGTGQGYSAAAREAM
ncbi:MAG: DNA (cytosine-5-)-methyltransferase [Planctomycetota bacterium]|nr:MAG: DNA (cytosine-5-)-methyltransferase [Planctomycetota bacterium]